MKIFLLSILLCFYVQIYSQEVSENNTDDLLRQATEEYQASQFQRSLQLTERALELAPDYHDIRLLQIRNNLALTNLSSADQDINTLLQKVPQYEGLKAVILQRINRFEDESKALAYLDNIDIIYPEDIIFQVKRSQLYLEANQPKEAKKLATLLIKKNNLEPGHRYLLQNILRQTVTDEIGVNYSYIGSSKEYVDNAPWHSISGEYQHNFGRTSTLARATYSNRGTREGVLYEVEAYPVLSKKLYTFVNLGISSGELFPDLRGSLSVFYNFARIFEAEIGGRVQKYNDDSFYTGILGLTVYHNKFFFNARTFLGPEINNKLVQNYQGNIRYYFSGVDNYIFLRAGNGISPDERILSTQALENPLLDAYYVTLGVNFSAGIHHHFQVGAGMLYEDLPNGLKGSQVIGSAGYRYRF